MTRGAVVLATVLALIAPAAASASSKPGVDVLAESNLTFDSVLVNARVDPNEAETTYFVQIGLTKLYGVNTAAASAGSGADPRRVSIPVGGLTPATKYHYRVVAQNKHGITNSGDRTFKTRNQPLGVTLAANPATVLPGAGSQLTGQLTGTNNANRDVGAPGEPVPVRRLRRRRQPDRHRRAGELLVLRPERSRSTRSSAWRSRSGPRS